MAITGPVDSDLALTEVLGPLNEFESKHAPDRVFVEGDVSLLRDTARVSVVGARKASANGLARARRLARILVTHRVVVVAGLAEGVDTAAHETAARAGGRTIAVLGTPLTECFPEQNADLQRELGARHLLVSQFASGTPTKRSNFPRRNRTMALLTHATVIIEASDASGALVQGWEALRLNKPLFILRSVVEDVSLRWPAEMLKYGARVLDDPDDLLDALVVDDRLSAPF